MRKIKFRAWDGANIQYPPAYEFGVSGVSGETSMAFPRGRGMLTTSYIMQYIEYTDNNGKDIYEGDILRDDCGRILEVGWRKGGFCFTAITKTNFICAYGILHWFEGDAVRPVIIGNIYEDLELMNGAD